jgi:hypothetical protein
MPFVSMLEQTEENGSWRRGLMAVEEGEQNDELVEVMKPIRDYILAEVERLQRPLVAERTLIDRDLLEIRDQLRGAYAPKTGSSAR